MSEETRDTRGGEPPPEGTGSPASPETVAWRRAYWRQNLRLMVILLAIWFAVSFGAGVLFADQLNEFEVNGFPIGFWFAQQGSIYTFLVLILLYAVLMDRLDDRFGVSERDENGVRQ